MINDKDRIKFGLSLYRVPIFDINDKFLLPWVFVAINRSLYLTKYLKLNNNINAMRL